MKKAVFFDVGDTLILTDPRKYVFPWLEQKGVVFQPKRLLETMHAVNAFYMPIYNEATTWESATTLWRGFYEVMFRELGVQDWEVLAEEFRLYCNEPNVLALNDGAHHVLETLKARGYKLAVISNWDASLEPILATNGLKQYFDAIFCSATFGFAKPSPKIFQAALESVNVAPQEVMHVGDHPRHDCAAAMALGIMPVLIGLEAHQDFRTIRALPELLEFPELRGGANAQG
jgi:putative hydrolase of the HAD superfamily